MSEKFWIIYVLIYCVYAPIALIIIKGNRDELNYIPEGPEKQKRKKKYEIIEIVVSMPCGAMILFPILYGLYWVFYGQFRHSDLFPMGVGDSLLMGLCLLIAIIASIGKVLKK